MAFNTKKTFDESVKFCQKIDGQIGVVTDVETHSIMERTWRDVCEMEDGEEYTFFTGHTDTKVRTDPLKVRGVSSSLTP